MREDPAAQRQAIEEDADVDEPEVVQIQVVDGDRAALQRTIERLVESRLVACGQLLGPIASTYRWQGEVERAEEHLALLKARADRAEAVVDAVAALHGYEMPEIVVLPVVAGLPAYLAWVREEAGGAGQ
jgi:periplasmic divalent cation tolerance protein